jgi:hypothetical protein
VNTSEGIHDAHGGAGGPASNPTQSPQEVGLLGLTQESTVAGNLSVRGSFANFRVMNLKVQAASDWITGP